MVFRRSPATRYRWGILALALLMAPLPFVDHLVVLGVFLFLAGFAISPTMIAAVSWVEKIVPADRLNEGMTVFTTGLVVGVAPGAAIVGAVVDRGRRLGVVPRPGRGGHPRRARRVPQLGPAEVGSTRLPRPAHRPTIHQTWPSGSSPWTASFDRVTSRRGSGPARAPRRSRRLPRPRSTRSWASPPRCSPSAPTSPQQALKASVRRRAGDGPIGHLGEAVEQRLATRDVEPEA